MNENEYIKQIEINGIKVEVDLRTCKTISTYKVGDNVKVLKKGYDNYQVYSGVIVDFVAFKERPAIVIAYFDQSYSGTDIKFETITQDSKDIEIAPCLPHELKVNKDRVIDKFDIAIAAKEREADDLRQKKDYFIQNFSKFFEPDDSNQITG
jgi:hypothetical protein